MNADLVNRCWFPNLASALLVAVLHVGVVWVMVVSVGGSSSIAIHAGQVSPATVLILDTEPPKQLATMSALANDKVLDVASPVPVALEAPHLPPDATVTDNSSPIGGLRMSWVSIERPSEEVLKWREAVRQAIERAWMKPNGTGVDSTCRVTLIQNTSGGVIGARVVQCDAEDSVRSSLVAAIFHASPLPPYPHGQPAKYTEIEFSVFNSVHDLYPVVDD